MKSSTVKQLLLVILLATGVMWTGTGGADEENETKTVIPTTAGEISKVIDTHVAELHDAIAASKLDTIHVHAYAVRDLVRALPTHSMSLSADALAKVEEQKAQSTRITPSSPTIASRSSAGKRAITERT